MGTGSNGTSLSVLPVAVVASASLRRVWCSDLACMYMDGAFRAVTDRFKNVSKGMMLPVAK